MKHGTPNQKQDAMSVWIAKVSTEQFEVCKRESRTFDGPHSNIMVVRHNFRALLVNKNLVLNGIQLGISI